MTLKIKMDEEHGDKYCSNLICALLSFTSIMALINTFIRSFIKNTYKIDTLLFYIVLLVFFIYAIPHIIKKINVKFLIFYLILTIIVLFSILSPNYLPGTILLYIDDLIIQCIPLLIAATCIKNFKYLIDRIYITGYLLLISNAFLLFVFNYYEVVGSSNYSQNGGYLISLGVVMIVVSQKRWIDVITIIFGTFMTISMGARGPIVVIGLAIIIYLLFIVKKSWKVILILSILTVLLPIIFIKFKDFLKSMEPFLEELGLSTRVITRVLNKSFTQDTARKSLLEFAFNYILEHPIFGSGVFADKKIIFEHMGVLASAHGDAREAYIHNIFLEIMFQFGLIPGLMICLTIIINIIIPFIKKYSNDYLILLSLAICCGLIPLLISFSYLWYAPFYFLIGLLLNKNKKVLKR